MVIHCDPPGMQNRRRELLIPIYKPVVGGETKELPSIRVVFLVFKGTDTTMEEYYKYLRDYVEQSSLEASREIYSVEIITSLIRWTNRITRWRS
jgi:hypothetical protein